MAMRGLNTFLTDLRNCRTREEEVQRVNKELANIRTKFKDPNLNGYQKKKYVSKLAFMYILGYDIEFGHSEAINLVSSSIHSEKSLGYLAVTLLVSDNPDFIRLVINTIRKDLTDTNEINCCLALNAIANIASRDMADSLGNDIVRLLNARSNFVKKKAALCLLCLSKKFPEIVPIFEWSGKINTAFESTNMGARQSISSLIIGLAKVHPDYFIPCIDLAIAHLQDIIIEGRCPDEYKYYSISAPWVQINLFKILQLYTSILTNEQLQNVNILIEMTLIADHDTLKNPQQANARLSVIIEAIKLAIHINSRSDHIELGLLILSPFISSKETNFRYIGLETLAHFMAYPETIQAVSKHLDAIIISLRDKDISVQRRALKLLFSICNSSNAQRVVNELMEYFKIASFEIHDELVLKIALLAEKFAGDYSWFFDVILNLIGTAGDQVGDEVWFRIVQIVTNNEEIRLQATSKLLKILKAPTCNEKTLRLGGYILGEYGHMIADIPECSPIEQFVALHSKFRSSSSQTRTLLLSSYLKMVNVFPEIKNEIIRVFKQFTNSLDEELQQRASEYLAICELPTDELLQAVCDEMPPYIERPNILVTQLQQKFNQTNLPNLDKTNDIKKKFEAIPQPLPEVMQVKKLVSVDLLNFDDSIQVSEFVQAENAVFFSKLLTEDVGVFYEDENIQIGLKTEYRNQMGKLAIFVGNKASISLMNVIARIESPQFLRIQESEPLANLIPALTQFHYLFDIECLSPFFQYPIFKFNFNMETKGLIDIKLNLPLTICKFLIPVQLNGNIFIERWNQIGGPPLEFKLSFISQYGVESIKKKLSALHFEILEKIDPNPLNIVAAGIFVSSDTGKVGCLLRIERRDSECLLTVRTTNEAVSKCISNNIEKFLI